MFIVEKGDVFTFDVLPDWAEYENIYFIVIKSELIKNEDENKLDIDVTPIVGFENHLVKGDNLCMTISKKDIEMHKPFIVKDSWLLAKLLLVE